MIQTMVPIFFDKISNKIATLYGNVIHLIHDTTYGTHLWQDRQKKNHLYGQKIIIHLIHNRKYGTICKEIEKMYEPYNIRYMIAISREMKNVSLGVQKRKMTNATKFLTKSDTHQGRASSLYECNMHKRLWDQWYSCNHPIHGTKGFRERVVSSIATSWTLQYIYCLLLIN